MSTDTVPKNKVQLYFRARDLPGGKKPVLVLSAVEKEMDFNGEQLRLRWLGKTEESLGGDTQPEWKTHIEMDYEFGTEQLLDISVYEEDAPNLRPDSSDGPQVLFKTNCTLAEVMRAPEHKLELPCQGMGTVRIAAIDLGIVDTKVKLKLIAENVKNMDTFSESDPYYVLSRILPDGGRLQIHKSKTIENNNNPQWFSCGELQLLQLATPGDFNAVTMEIEVYDANPITDSLIGVAQFSFNDLVRADLQRRDGPMKNVVVAGTESFQPIVIHPELNSGPDHGHIVVKYCEIVNYFTFPQRLANGLQFHLSTSVDFGSSTNFGGGNPAMTDLHNSPGGIGPTTQNQYTRTMTEVLSSLVQYAPAQRTAGSIPSYGFCVDEDCNVEDADCFNLFSSSAAAGTTAVEKVVSDYLHTLQMITAGGQPKNLAPVIKRVAQDTRQLLAAADQAHNAANFYAVHIVFTDGDLGAGNLDPEFNVQMKELVDALVPCDELPLTILFIAVPPSATPSSEFGKTQQRRVESAAGVLNRGLRSSGADDTPPRNKRRDMCHFVQGANYVKEDRSSFAVTGSVVKELLKVIPWQVFCYHALRAKLDYWGPREE